MQGKKIENSKEINASQQSKTLQSDTSVAPTEEKEDPAEATAFLESSRIGSLNSLEYWPVNFSSETVRVATKQAIDDTELLSEETEKLHNCNRDKINNNLMYIPANATGNYQQNDISIHTSMKDTCR